MKSASGQPVRVSSTITSRRSSCLSTNTPKPDGKSRLLSEQACFNWWVEQRGRSLSKKPDKYRGWEDPVGQLVRIRAALDIMLSFRDNYRKRMEDVTSVLANVRRETVPERIRPVINRIMDVR